MPSIQIQSILYHNKKAAILRTIDCMANAIRVGKENGYELDAVTFIYGDASATALFTESEVKELAEIYSSFFSFKVQVFNENTGTAKGHNLLGKTAISDYILIINPDVLASPQLFVSLLEPFCDNKRNVGITEARQTPIEHSKCFDVNTGETSWASTACAMFPTEVFHKVEGFDSESFFLYCDDLDFSWRVRLAGYQIIYVPNAPVYHAKRLSSKGEWLTTEAEKYYSMEAALMLTYKWSYSKQHKVMLNALLACPKESAEKKAALAFMEKQDKGSLPPQLDPKHTIADINEFGYGKYRFMYESVQD